MRILMIAPCFLPYTFSENLCTGKLALALVQQGHQLRIISRKYEGVSYSFGWDAPWDVLRPFTHEITYPAINFKKHPGTLLKSVLRVRYPFAGARWAAEAVEEGKKLLDRDKYDCIISRSPNDSAHVVGYHLAHYSRVPWIANWNDPVAQIWPEPYTHSYSKGKTMALDFYVKRQLRRADCNTFPSDSLRLFFQKNYPFLSQQYCAVLPHIGLAPAHLPPVVVGKHDGVMRLCHSGNLSGERNPAMLFQALARFNERHPGRVHLDILGHRTAECDQLQQKYKLESIVGYPGSFTYLQALAKMAEYDVLVLLEAQLENGIFFASKIVDYVQLNKPIWAISPLSGFAADYLSKHGVCTVANTSSEAIGASLEQLYQHFCDGALEQSFATQTLQKEFSPETVVQSLEHIVNKLNRFRK